MIDETNSTRRQMIAGGALGLAAAARAGAAKPGTILTTKAIHQEEDFKCGAQRIYAVSYTHLSGSPDPLSATTANGSVNKFRGVVATGEPADWYPRTRSKSDPDKCLRG